jgi:hypothetical protein
VQQQQAKEYERNWHHKTSRKIRKISMYKDRQDEKTRGKKGSIQWLTEKALSIFSPEYIDHLPCQRPIS